MASWRIANSSEASYSKDSSQQLRAHAHIRVVVDGDAFTFGYQEGGYVVRLSFSYRDALLLREGPERRQTNVIKRDSRHVVKIHVNLVVWCETWIL
jgi:hypothetical protein